MSDQPSTPQPSDAAESLSSTTAGELARLAEALRESEERLRALELTSPVGILHADVEGRIVRVNARLVEMAGVPEEELLGHAWTRLIHPDDLDGLLASWRMANASGRTNEYDFRLRLENGSVRSFRGRSTVLRNAAGAIIGSLATVEELTDRQRAEAALQASEARLSGIIASATDAIVTTDAQQRIVLANQAAERVFGYRMEELIGQPLDLLIPERFRSAHRTHVERFGTTGISQRTMGGPGTLAHVDLAGRRRDGSEFPIEASISQVVTTQGRFYTVILRDVTERRQADEERERLLAAERRAARSARLLQSLTAEFSAVLTPPEVVRVVLEEATDAVGARTGLVALVSEDGTALEVAGARGYPPGVIERYRRMPMGLQSPITAGVRSGEPVWLSHPDEAVREYPPMTELYQALGIRATAAIPLVDGRGRSMGALAFHYDAPRTFDADERALLCALARQFAQALERAQLFEAERAAREEAQRRRAEAEEANAAKSRFLAMTSHEIRTPINAILGYTELLQLRIPGPLTEAQQEYLQRIRLSGQHLLNIVNQVLDLSKIEADKLEVKPKPAGAAAVAAKAVAIVEPQAEARGVLLTNACASSDVAYTGDPERVEQILVNLLSNAVKFTDAGGRVTVTCGLARRPSADAEVSAEAQHGWAYFRIEDTGIGMPPDRLQAIWEPFEQVDAGHTRLYGGTGLGLTISRRLARLMGGDITVRSAPGAGSLFLVWLPAAPPEVPDEREAGASGGAPPHDRRGPGGGTRRARGLGRASGVVLAEIERVLSGYTARLRTDPGTPAARRLNDEELEDHIATLLADMAHCLAVIEGARGAASPAMRDSTEIQRVVAERHGMQRARLGWSAAEVRREFAILGEELAAALRRRLEGDPEVELEPALALLRGFLERAESVAVGGMR